MQTLLLSTPNVRQANRINYLLKDETLESHLNTVNQTKANTRHYTYKIFAAHAIVGADEKISTRAVNHVHVWMNCTQTRSETQWNERTSEYIYNVTPRLWRYCLINRIIKLNKKEEKIGFHTFIYSAAIYVNQKLVLLLLRSYIAFPLSRTEIDARSLFLSRTLIFHCFAIGLNLWFTFLASALYLYRSNSVLRSQAYIYIWKPIVF